MSGLSTSFENISPFGGHRLPWELILKFEYKFTFPIVIDPQRIENIS